MCQYVKLYLFPPRPLHALLYRFGQFTHHPAVFIIFVQLALLCHFIILVFPILPIVVSSKITETVSHSNHHLVKCLFGPSVGQSGVFTSLQCFLLLRNHYLSVFNSISSTSFFALNIISQSISLSHHCFRSVYLIVPWPQAAFLIASCAIPQGLGLIVLPYHSCLHSLDDVIGCTGVSSCQVCSPALAIGSVVEHCPVKFALTLLLGEISDFARYGQSEDKLQRVCQGCISEKHFRAGRIAVSEWTGSTRDVRETPVADYSAAALNTARHITYRTPIMVSPLLPALFASYFCPSLRHCGQL